MPKAGRNYCFSSFSWGLGALKYNHLLLQLLLVLFESGAICVFFVITSHNLPPFGSPVEMLRKLHFIQAFCDQGILFIDNFCNKQHNSQMPKCRIHQYSIILPLLWLNKLFKLENVGHMRILILPE